jgi:glycosyltransferase involved in cell wall biosynthesis
MRIAYVIDSLFSGGAQRQAVELAVALGHSGAIDARFFVYHAHDFHAQTLHDAHIPVTQLRKSRKLDPLFPLRLRSALRSARVDVVHAFMLDPSIWAAAALKLLPGSRRSPALLASERLSLIATSKAMTAKQRFAYRRADAVSANSAPVAEAIEKRIGVPKERVHYIPNGIDLEKWEREREQSAELELRTEAFNVGLVGRIEPEKNHVLVVRAIAALEPSLRSQISVWFVGSDASATNCRSEIESEIERLGVGDQIRFAGPQRRIAPLIAQLDVLVLPSLHEAFPNTVLEAMASGIPVLASAVGDVPYMIEDGHNGWTISPHDPNELASRLRELWSMSATERDEMGSRGKSIVAARYQMSAIAERYQELYRQLISAS